MDHLHDGSDVLSGGPALPRMGSQAGSGLASFFLGGFECSGLVRPDGTRLDLLASTGHADWALEDYRTLRSLGIDAVRDGVRWSLIETGPGRYDWSSLVALARAARRADMQVVWDLCHYGWPGHLDIWSPAFPAGFARFAGEAARVIADVTGRAPLLCPVNEISFWAWAGGETGRLGPCATGRGAALKRQLVRASLAATAAARDAVPGCRFVCAEPAIHIDAGADASPETLAAVERTRLAQFEAIDLLTGRLEPELGGRPDSLDLVGLNLYPDNQWYWGGSTIPLGHHAFRPVSEMIAEWQSRYGRPVFLAETGAEGSGRAAWLHYIGDEVHDARGRGVPVTGICLYPVLDYRGWTDDRICRAGLLSHTDAKGRRQVHEPLLMELRRQQARFGAGASRTGGTIAAAA